MNQILATNEESGLQNDGMKPITRFFAIVAIVFALALAGVGIYRLCTRPTNKDFPKPIMSYEQNGSSINLKIGGEIGISKVIYAWGDGSETIVVADGRKDFNFDVEIPQGDSVLKTRVVDVQGNKTSFADVNVSFSSGKDGDKPKISIDSENGKLSIVAVDETEMDYLLYQWEGEEEVKVTANEEDKTTIKQIVNVEKGSKQLTITAVDKAGNRLVRKTKVVGSNGPTIKASIVDNNFVVKVTAETKLTDIQYTLNDETKKVENLPKDAKEFEFKVPLKEGSNYLKINAYEGSVMSEYKCKKTK